MKPVDPAVQGRLTGGMTERASLTLNAKYGPALWLGKRCVARIEATVEDSRITSEEPEPRWRRDAMVFVNAVNRHDEMRDLLTTARRWVMWLEEPTPEQRDAWLAQVDAAIPPRRVQIEALSITEAIDDGGRSISPVLPGDTVMVDGERATLARESVTSKSRPQTNDPQPSPTEASDAPHA